MKKIKEKNVLGTDLEPCCYNPLTGFMRDGYCSLNNTDRGTHIACALITDEFLNYTKSKGNDLTTPILEYNFPGLKAGDKWCLCILRWREAFEAGVAPRLKLEATHERALEYVSRLILEEFRI